MHTLIEFFFPRQLRRLSYFIRTLLLNAVFAYFHPAAVSLSALDIFSIAAAVIYWAGFVALPRMRDIGMHPGWLVMAFIPFANVFLAVVLLFRRSDIHQNPLLRATSPRETAPPSAGSTS